MLVHYFAIFQSTFAKEMIFVRIIGMNYNNSIKQAGTHVRHERWNRNCRSSELKFKHERSLTNKLLVLYEISQLCLSVGQHNKFRTLE